MDNNFKETFSSLFECEIDEIVDKYGFGYDEEKNKIYYLEGDSCVEVQLSQKELFKEIILAYESNDEYKYELICKLLGI